MDDPRGSMWHKWDLHVHSPESIVQKYSGADPWERFIRELEQLPAEFKVIGINDYIFLDGYKRILNEKAKGRLTNIDLFLPVIELRLDKFGGTAGHLSKVNYHIIFSDEISPDLIEQQFLYALSSKYVLTPHYEKLRTSGKWCALPTRQSLTDLGKLIIDSVPAEERIRFGNPMIVGFQNLCFSLNDLEEVLGSHYFKNKVVTAVGKTEWADIKWNDQSIAEKKTIINAVGFVFVSAESVDGWAKAKRSLTDAGVNNRLLDCSDAHMFSDSDSKDRIGKCFTWIKADTTFKGLLQVLNEQDERIYVGEIPPKMVQVQNNKTKYIESLRIERKPEAMLGEIWFDNFILFNPGLVAIIGNKGKGKSALTDMIGLLCNTRQHRDFTFLSVDNFRQPIENKARNFRATLKWESGACITKGIDESVDEHQPELVKYIPQNFLEKICTQIGKVEESDFDRELKKVIFSHVDPTDRLGKATLDELIAYKTSEANVRLQILKQELHRINEEIVRVEVRIQPEYRLEIQNLLAQKKRELDIHGKSKPLEVTKPDNDPKKQKEMVNFTAAIEAAEKELTTYEEKIVLSKEDHAKLTQLISVVDRLMVRLENLEKQIAIFKAESQTDLKEIDLTSDTILTLSVNRQPLFEKRAVFVAKKTKTDEKLDSSKTESLVNKKLEVEKRIEKLKVKLDEPNKKYQAYTAALKSWEKQRNEIIGSENTLGTMKYYEKQLQELDVMPGRLFEARKGRLTKTKEIHGVIRKLAGTYRELYAPVHQFIEKRAIAREKFQLNFEVSIVDTGFQEGFFDIISHGVIGTFCGVEEGVKMIQDILGRHDFETETGIEAFLAEINDSLENDKRPAGKSVRLSDQIRKGKTVLGLYDLIFSLDYLKPRYSLRMGDKELHQLSPGERGTILLVFYLLVDKDDIPLIIDQPEENLDNQTVYELLVPCMKEAKQGRQIIIVTHNPNLAVVCDAEQVICADLDKKNNFRMNYLAGSIENPALNRAIVDILEGTMPAFDNRDSKYFNPD